MESPQEAHGASGRVIENLTDEDFARAAAELNCDVAAIRAVAEVESRGNGFIADGRPQILYEAHVFHRLTGGQHAEQKDRNGIALSSPKWDRSLYGRAGAAQHDRLKDAAFHDWSAAHKACSWGMFQVLGSNHLMVGCPTIQDFVNAMHHGPAAHLQAFVKFIQAKRLDEALRRHDWVAFARGYNGSGFAANKYDIKLRDAFHKWKEKERTK
jgi:hypothetical protein